MAKTIELVDSSQLQEQLELQFGRLHAEIAELKQIKLKEQNKRMLTPKEACEFLGVSSSSLYRYVRNGYLPIKKIGRKTIFQKSDVLKLIQNVNSKEAYYEKN